MPSITNPIPADAIIAVRNHFIFIWGFKTLILSLQFIMIKTITGIINDILQDLILVSNLNGCCLLIILPLH